MDLDNSLVCVVLYMYCSASLLFQMCACVFVVVSLFIHIWMDLDKILGEVLEGDGRVALVDEVPDGRLGQ